MENLGLIGAVLRDKIKESSRRLTKDEINFLESNDIVPRGTGFVDVKTGKFVSNAVIDNIIADYRGKAAVKVTNSVSQAVSAGGADPVYTVISSINDSIEKLFGVITQKPEPVPPAKVEPAAKDAGAAVESPFQFIIDKFKSIIKSGVFWAIQIGVPIVEMLKAGFKHLSNFADSLKGIFTDSIFPFFTQVIPSIFDTVKVFFTEKLPEYFELFMVAAKDAVTALLDLPKKLFLQMENYAVSFGQNILDTFGPWVSKLGVDTSEVAAKLENKQKQIRNEQAILDQKRRDSELARKKAEQKIREEYAAKAAAREAAERAAKAAAAQPKPTPAPAPAAPTPKPAPSAAPAAKPTPAPAPVAPPKPAAPPSAPAPKAAAPAPAKPGLDTVTRKADGVDTNKLNPALKDRVAMMAADYYQKTGKKLLITSGYRSNEKQKELWDAELARQGGNVAKARKLVAPPPPIGKGSKHASGLAVDINSKGNDGLNVLAGDRTKSTGWLEKFGLSRPVNKENWHVQLAGDEPIADNPDSPGDPTVIPGSKKILADGPPKDVTAQYDSQVNKKSMPSAGPVATPVSDKDLILPTRPVADALATASNKVGVELPILYAIAKQESGFNAAAASKGSSAKGLFQFVSNTWEAMVKEYKSSFPELTRGPLDPIANAIAGALYIKENIQALSKKGIPINATSIYAAHFLGTYGASKLLSSNRDAIAAPLFPKQAAVNKNVFYDKDRPRTVGEIIQLLYGKVGQYADKYAAVITPMSGTQVASATRAADIKAPKPAAPTNVASVPQQQIKTAALSGTNDSVPNVAAVIRRYKDYFSVA